MTTHLEDAALLYAKARDTRDALIRAWQIGTDRPIPMNVMELINARLNAAEHRLKQAARAFAANDGLPKCNTCGCPPLRAQTLCNCSCHGAMVQSAGHYQYRDVITGGPTGCARCAGGTEYHTCGRSPHDVYPEGALPVVPGPCGCHNDAGRPFITAGCPIHDKPKPGRDHCGNCGCFEGERVVHTGNAALPAIFKPCDCKCHGESP